MRLKYFLFPRYIKQSERAFDRIKLLAQWNARASDTDLPRAARDAARREAWRINRAIAQDYTRLDDDLLTRIEISGAIATTCFAFGMITLFVLWAFSLLSPAVLTTMLGLYAIVLIVNEANTVACAITLSSVVRFNMSMTAEVADLLLGDESDEEENDG